jgi:hypothetical protein
MKRFTLNEDKATAWVHRAIAYTRDPFCPNPDPYAGEQYPVIRGTYSVRGDARNRGNATGGLVLTAQGDEVITDAEATGPVLLVFQFIPQGEDAAAYQWQLQLSTRLYASTQVRWFVELGGDNCRARGVDLALAVLREAVDAGNQLTSDLAHRGLFTRYAGA